MSAAIPSIPYNFIVQQANRQVLLTWNISAGATSYQIQRSLDGVNFGLYATTTLPSYLDTAVTIGTQYFYKVASAAIASAVSYGTMTLTGQPNPGDSFSLANIVFTAVASGATGNQFNIGSTIAATVANIVTVVTPALNMIVVPSAISPVITFSAYSPGPEGNGIQFSSSLTNASISAFSGGSNGSLSPYTAPQSVVPTPTGEMSLGEIRLKSMQRCDLVNSQFVTTSEWNSYINQSMFELYDILVTSFEDYYLAPPTHFTTQPIGLQQFYPLPDGFLTFQHLNGTDFVPPPFYKLRGVDLAINTANNASVTVDKFVFESRNNYVYPNTASTIYGVFNLQYRLMGDKIEFIPAPSGNQRITLWYIPRIKELLQDTDITTVGFSGWLEYVIIRSAILAMTKEESDTTMLVSQLLDVRKRIEAAAQNRDAGQPDTITNIRLNGYWSNSSPFGYSGANGGY